MSKKKDSFHAKIAFWLSLGFWVPLFNIGLCIASLIIAINSLKKYNNDPKKYGGYGYIITAIVLSSTSILLTVLGVMIYLQSKSFCGSAFCQAIP